QEYKPAPVAGYTEPLRMPETTMPKGATVAPQPQPAGQGEPFQHLAGIWPEVIRAVRAKKMSAGIYLEEGRLVEIKGSTVVVGFPRLNTLHKEALESKQNMEIIAATLKELMEKDFFVSFVFIESDDLSRRADTPAAPEAAAPAKKMEPIIKSALDKFNGKIVRKYFVKEED
ncbi:MAG: hypothetical protein PHS37_09240, partial [Candidatus Omnitrophica bacterium]|nr:hypothetical protein [Candidatus Omnitrophota bacterium]